jgi:hypothetical protein
MCDDCQAFALFLERPDVLDAHGGTEIFQTTPSRLRIESGGEQLRCMRLSEKGMLRWYAGCCNTPIANTADVPKLPFVGVIHAIMDDAEAGRSRDAALGPALPIMAKFALGPPPASARSGVPASLLLRSAALLLRAFLRREYTPSPLFDVPAKRPRVEPHVLTPQERERLRVRRAELASQWMPR